MGNAQSNSKPGKKHGWICVGDDQACALPTDYSDPDRDAIWAKEVVLFKDLAYMGGVLLLITCGFLLAILVLLYIIYRSLKAVVRRRR